LERKSRIVSPRRWILVEKVKLIEPKRMGNTISRSPFETKEADNKSSKS